MVAIDIVLENDMRMPIDAYGIGFQVFYDLPNLPPNATIRNIYVNVNDSWLGQRRKDIKTIIHNDDDNKIIDVGITRYNHKNASGSGPIATIIALIDNLPTRIGSLQIDIALDSKDGVYITQNDGIEIPVGNFDNFMTGLKTVTLFSEGVDRDIMLNASGGQAGMMDLANIPTLETFQFQLYPNPATDRVTINYEIEEKHFNDKATLSIYDYTGKQIHQQQLSTLTGQLELPITHLAAGLYFVQLQTDAIILGKEKLVVIE